MSCVAEKTEISPENYPYLKLKLTKMTISGNGINKTEEIIVDGNSFEVITGGTQVKFGKNKARSRKQPIEEWNDYVEYKLSQGWKIISTHKTSVLKREVKKGNGYKEVKDPKVKELLKILITTMENFMAETFVVKVEEIPDDNIQKAWDIIEALKKDTSVAAFNQRLLSLWTVIPRPIRRMKSLMAVKDSDFEGIIQRETDLLLFLEDQIKMAKRKTTEDTILEANHLDIRPCNEDEIKEIKDLMEDSKSRFVRAYKVNNSETEKSFNQFCKSKNLTLENGGVKKLFHGSNTENWWSIFVNGLYLDPAKVKSDVCICGKAFGYGIYFAPKARKSIGYAGGHWRSEASEHRYLAVFRVATGNPYYIYDNYNGIPQNAADLEQIAPGKDCTWAEKGKSSTGGLWTLMEDEVIVYNQSQCTIEYIVEFN